MKELELIEEGFAKKVVTAEESGNKEDYYYYEYKLNDTLTLMSSDNEEVLGGVWLVHLYDWDVTIKDIEDVKTLIALFDKWNRNS